MLRGKNTPTEKLEKYLGAVKIWERTSDFSGVGFPCRYQSMARGSGRKAGTQVHQEHIAREQKQAMLPTA